MRDLKYWQQFSPRHSVTSPKTLVFTTSIKTYCFNWSFVDPCTGRDLQKKVSNTILRPIRIVVTSTWITSHVPAEGIVPRVQNSVPKFSLSFNKHSRRTVPLRHYFAVVTARSFISWQLHGCWKGGEFQTAEHHIQLAEALRDHDISFSVTLNSLVTILTQVVQQA